MNKITLEDENYVVSIIDKQESVHISDMINMFRLALKALSYSEKTVEEYLGEWE